MPQARAIIRHAIRLPRDVETPRLIMEQPLVHGLEAKKVRRGPLRRDCPLGRPRQSGKVVGARSGGGLKHVGLAGRDISRRDDTSQLEFRVVYDPARVGVRHERRHDVLRELMAPQDGAMACEPGARRGAQDVLLRHLPQRSTPRRLLVCGKARRLGRALPPLSQRSAPRRLLGVGEERPGGNCDVARRHLRRDGCAPSVIWSRGETGGINGGGVQGVAIG